MTTLRTGIVVIGAGAAGLAAAKRLNDRGADFLVLEARERIGGRAFTVRSHDGLFPVELGAEFVHGNPQSTLSLLRESGERAIGVSGDYAYVRDGHVIEMPDQWENAERVLQRVDVNGPDQSVQAYLDALPRDEISQEARDDVRAAVEGFDAAISSDASVIAIAKEWRSGLNDVASRPVNGYAPLMQHLARAAHERLLLRTRVDEISWSAGSVNVRATRSGEPIEVQARAAIVSLPIGVLRAQNVRFTPELPELTRSAIAAIAMGPVLKVVLEFRTPFWESLDGGIFREVAFFRAPGSGFRTIWARLPERTPLLVAWAGGTAAQRLVVSHVDPLEEALRGCEMLFPRADVRAELLNTYFHDWQSDPFACGAYSFLRVGGGEARSRLAQPIEQTLFFAGEATSSDDTGTVAGALDSGYHAAAYVEGGSSSRP